MPVIHLGDNVRLTGASGNYGVIEDINVVYVANQEPATVLYIRTVTGKLAMKFADQVSPLHGTIKQGKTDTPAAETGIKDIEYLSREFRHETGDLAYTDTDRS